MFENVVLFLSTLIWNPRDEKSRTCECLSVLSQIHILPDFWSNRAVKECSGKVVFLLRYVLRPWGQKWKRNMRECVITCSYCICYCQAITGRWEQVCLWMRIEKVLILIHRHRTIFDLLGVSPFYRGRRKRKKKCRVWRKAKVSVFFSTVFIHNSVFSPLEYRFHDFYRFLNKTSN